MTANREATSTITLEGVRTHNLRNIHLNIRRNSLTVVCGVSGSGKSSLAFDTLFAEGQRRYIETFSPYARQFLDRVERPDVDRIDGIPPAIAIRQNARTNSVLSTIGTRTELLDYFRILFAKAGEVVCPDCDCAAEQMTADSAAQHLIQKANGRRGMLLFDAEAEVTFLEHLQASGFARCIVDGRTTSLEEILSADISSVSSVQIVADRIRIDESGAGRMAESIELVFASADGRCVAVVETDDDNASDVIEIDGKRWIKIPLSQRLQCLACGKEFESPTAEALNFQSPLGACAACEGTGQISGMSFDKVVPDDSISLRDGAIQPWTTPAYRHELDELLGLAPEYGIPVDVPFAELGEHHRRLIHDGVPENEFGGLVGFHRWLVRNRYKQGVSVYLNRWRSWITCPDCSGNRLSATAGIVKLKGLTITDLAERELSDVATWVQTVVSDLPAELASALSAPIQQLNNRLNFLNGCGLGYLSLNRTMKSLSGGEAQRVVLTAALGSGLINTLYVLDEPTSGLHADDAAKVIQAARRLQRLGNTVVVVEHDPDFIIAADEVIEIGPGAGEAGGEVAFQGNPAALLQSASTATGNALAHRDDADATVESSHATKREPTTWLTFRDVCCHNIHSLSGEIPLDVIAAVTGVSGSGKSSLMVDALYPQICRQLGQLCDINADSSIAELTGLDALSEVCLLDQSPVRGNRRSIPATSIGCFDEIRKVMAETHEAKKRNYKPGMFSFNSSKGGRCPNCEGHGVVTVEMQFLADIQTTCEACGGRRFRPDVLEVRYRDRSIHDILQMTTEQAFTFFNGHRKIQQRLNALRQAGLGYIRLGQPVSTLSGGEAQRLRIAALLAGVNFEANELPASARSAAAAKKTPRTLFILDEPSTGLHMQDIAALMKCLSHLVEIGHSVIVIEHDQEVVRHADYVVELGPGPGKLGGQIIASGTPQGGFSANAAAESQTFD